MLKELPVTMIRPHDLERLVKGALYYFILNFWDLMQPISRSRF